VRSSGARGCLRAIQALAMLGLLAGEPLLTASYREKKTR